MTGLYVNVGEGGYMKNSAPQTKVAGAMMQYGLQDILGDLVIPCDRPFVLCDYGAADGGASHDVIADIIGYLRRKHPKLPICVVNVDQPEADYNSLFKLLHGKLGKQSYKEKYPGVYISAVGGSFYEQCLPDDSVHLTLSTTSMHWLSTLPCKMTQSIMPGRNTCLEEERQIYVQQMIKDFTVNLLHRAREMVTGSYLVIVIPTELLDNYNVVTVETIWKMYSKIGRITQKEFLDTNFQCGDLTREEILSLFAGDTEVSAAGLQLVKLSELDFTCPFRPKLISGEWSPEEFAHAYVDVHKMVMYCALYDGLSPSRSHMERDNIVQQLHADLAKAIATDPGSFPTTWKSHLIVIKKVM